MQGVRRYQGAELGTMSKKIAWSRTRNKEQNVKSTVGNIVPMADGLSRPDQSARLISDW